MDERVRIRRAVLDAVRAHAIEDPSHECCGLLLGTAGVVANAWRAHNDDPSPSRYLVRPADHFAAIRHARALGLAVVGAYHSHPRTAAEPSPRDRDEAWGGGFLYVIAGPVSAQPIPVTGWRVADGNFRPVVLVPVE